MSKYQPLADHLAALRDPVWRPSFAELESVLGFRLPKAARKPRWWERGETSVAVLCLKRGWIVDHVDGDEGAVKFRRVDRGEWTSAPERRQEARSGQTPQVPWLAVVGGAALALAGVALVASRQRSEPRVRFTKAKSKARPKERTVSRGWLG